MSTPLHTPDFAALKTRARAMTDAELAWNRQDANEAAKMADELDRAGCRIQKTGGFYRDEAGVYASEITRRLNR